MKVKGILWKENQKPATKDISEAPHQSEASDLPEAKAIRLARQGDAAGFERIYRLHSRMEHLKLSPRSWRVGGDECVLRPTENGINANFLRAMLGIGTCFAKMPEISNVRLNRQAFAEVLGIRLQNTDVAGDTKQCQQSHMLPTNRICLIGSACPFGWLSTEE